MFGAVAVAIRDRSIPSEAPRAAAFSAGRLPAPARGASEDEWWSANLGRVLVSWALVEAPALLGLVVFTLTHDFRTLLAPFIGLLLFANYHPRRLTER
jgi:hypothetical protein